MDATMIFIICTAITVVVSILIRAVWDWAGNKSEKKEIEKINENIEEQRKEFSVLKALILVSYVKKDDFEKHLARFEDVRDKTLSNENTMNMIIETVRQNVQRMSQLENS